MKKKTLLILFLTIFIFIPFINVKADGTYNIYVRDFRGHNSSYEVAPTTTILELKTQIEDVKGIPTARQKLFFAATELEDDKTISDYNIQLEATVHLRIYWDLKFDKKIKGDASDVNSVLVEDRKLYEPEEPTRDGYTFDGWYLEGSDTEFDFANTTIESDNNFYAKWIANPEEAATSDEKTATTSDKGTKTATKTSLTNPNTKDNIILYLSLLILSFGGFVITLKKTSTI